MLSASERSSHIEFNSLCAGFQNAYAHEVPGDTNACVTQVSGARLKLVFQC